MKPTSLINSIQTCMLHSFVDWRIREFVARRANLANTYVMVSLVAEFTTCFVKTMVPDCKDNLVCDLSQGASTYAARASVLDQDLVARAMLWRANKLAYSQLKFVGAPVVIEVLEAVSVDIIKKAAGYQIDFMTILADARLGMEVGLLCVVYGDVIPYAYGKIVEYYNESLSISNHEVEPSEVQVMGMIGEG